VTTVSEPDAAAQLEQADPVEPPLRVVTAASLFDGHDAAINVIRRLIQAAGAEVVHLGHDRGAAEVVRAAIQEDADAIAVSSYQGGHLEYFAYMVDLLREAGAGHIPVFGGGGGTITPAEIAELQAYGVERLYHPDDGLSLGLEGMVSDLVERTRARRVDSAVPATGAGTDLDLARMLSALEDEAVSAAELEGLRSDWGRLPQAPVVGVTGTGGAGKSTVTDELVRRFLALDDALRVAVIAVDPTRRRTGGALLGDRMRFNSLSSERAYFRSFATRRRHLATSAVLGDAVAYLRTVADLVFVETAGIGQSDSEIVDLVDVPVYVMTAEYGAPSQLEKIDMLDLASLVVLNKSDRRGAADALRAVRRQWKRNHLAFTAEDSELPVIAAVASRFGDPGTTRVFSALVRELRARGATLPETPVPVDADAEPVASDGLVPGVRAGYLGEIATLGRAAREDVEARAAAAATAHHCYEALRALGDPDLPAEAEPFRPNVPPAPELAALRARYGEALAALGSETAAALRGWPALVASLTGETYAYEVRGKTVKGSNYRETLSGLRVPKIAPPRLDGWGDRVRFLLSENVPGKYPYTAGVYPYRRENEDPTRMFAGEGTPEQTNRRFHYLAAGQPAARLSTAFDSVTLYGNDPARRLDIYGKVGNSGVSVPTLDDAKKLYSGFDLCAPSTSVSMTINGPAPIILAFFLNAAIDQQVERHLRERGEWDRVERELDATVGERPRYDGALPPGHDGIGLGLLGVSGDRVVDAETYATIRARTLAAVRGTVQADILKEDQAQNTCIFSTEFALKLMGDVQESFAANGVRNFYSVSISGYHIAEAGANPITQLAFTLANGFTIVEYYLARGMTIDDFAPNLSFFFSNGMDPEYTVLGRVARRIWARALRERYGASARSQMLKYHIQTSGRSLHAQEIAFNDIRTTLQALTAIVDNCSSLHTNAYDEAVTTPTEESVRRAVAIQLVINRELGLAACENPLQGSFLVSALTDLVEEAVYAEFDRLSERGGVLGAMDVMYQRGKIQDESLLYETRKHDGTLPIVGVNTFLPPDGARDELERVALQRSTDVEKTAQIESVAAFSRRHATGRPAALARLQQVARDGGNVFDELLETVKVATLGEIAGALFEVGGEYRRSM
jgi:methylmalonyl-CoA mutase